MSDTMRYTKQELIKHAKAHRIGVSSSQFDDWKGDGYLPTPEPELKATQGRPRLLYPDPAPDAVIWLGTHRRFIDGGDVTKFWMWLDGFDYIEVDPAAVVIARIEALWRQAQQAIPSLPALEEVAAHGLDDAVREVLLDELAAHYATAEEGEDTSTLGAALFGVIPPDWIAPSPADDHASVVDDLAILTNEGRARVAAPLKLTLPRLVQAGQLINLYRGLRAGQVGFLSLRLAWQQFTPEAVADIRQTMPLFTSLRGVTLPRTRTDLMRSFFHYDPYLWLTFMVSLAAAWSALNPPQKGGTLLKQ